MPKLIVYAYGNQPGTSADMLLQFLHNHLFAYNDRLLLVSGYDGDDVRTLWPQVAQRIQQEIEERSRNSNIAVAFSGARANAQLLHVNLHEQAQIYSRVYAHIRHLLVKYVLDDKIGSMGDGHPQVVVAMTDACLRFPNMNIWFVYGSHARTVTRLIHDTISTIPTDLSRLIVYNHKMSPNVYHDMHQFIEQMNVLLKNHEYDAVRTSIYAKYAKIALTRELDTIRNQWNMLADGLRYWHNFMHGDAYNKFNMLHHFCDANMPQHVRDSLNTIRRHLDICRWQHSQFEQLGDDNTREDVVMSDRIADYRGWLNTNGLHGYELAIDKYMNAMRCIDQCRFDDASVRLSSIIEMITKIRLLLKYNIVTKNMSEATKAELLGRTPFRDGTAQVSRIDLYRMLVRQDEDKSDSLRLVYDGLGSQLELAIRKRHKSYLVHGNSVLSEPDCREFAGFVKKLLEAASEQEIDVEAYEMPRFKLEVNFELDGTIHPIGWAFDNE